MNSGKKKDDPFKTVTNVSYLDKYGGSIYAAGAICVGLFVLTSYFNVQGHMQNIKANWVEERCKPSVLPFAGIINAPQGKSSFEYADENFSQCTQQTLGEIAGYAMAPINYADKLAGTVKTDITSSIQDIRKSLGALKAMVQGIVKEVLGRTENVLIPLQGQMIGVRSALDRTHATLTATIYTAMTGLSGLMSFFYGFVEILFIAIAVLIASAAALFALGWIPFVGIGFIAAGVAAMVIAVMVTVMAVEISVAVAATDTVGAENRGCFDKNTKIALKKAPDGMPIESVKIGDTLASGSKVTATFKVSTYGKRVYRLEETIVTGCHKVRMYDGQWIDVSEHPDAIEIEDYRQPYVYCLNTTSKRIEIGDQLFLDWDEIDETDWAELQQATSGHLPVDRTAADIHKHLESGFIGETLVDLEDGRSIPLKDVKVNDQLRLGERVLGIVEIDTEHIESVLCYNLKGKLLIGGPNLRLCDGDLGDFSTLEIGGVSLEKPNKLYHLITDSKRLQIGGTYFYDYDGGLEQILDAPPNYQMTF